MPHPAAAGKDKAVEVPEKKAEDKMIAESFPKADSKSTPEAGEEIFTGIRTEDEIFDNLISGKRSKQRYTGEKIALDFYDTDIKNVFRIIIIGYIYEKPSSFSGSQF